MALPSSEGAEVSAAVNVNANLGDLLKDGVEKGAEIWNGTAGAVGGAISFASDPLKAIFEATRDGARGLATEVLPALVHATEPDLSADFFIRAYAISFAAAILLWGILLIMQFVDLSRNKIAGQDFIDTVFLNSSIFFGGALFGPWVGVFLVKLFGSMSQGIIEWGVGGSADQMLGTLTEMLDKDPAAIPGGVIVGILLMVCMILGFLLVLLMLVVMLVTLYMSGAVMPLGLVWITSNRHHEMAWKIPVLWLGLLAAHPLLFFLMGFAFTMIASTATWMMWEDGLATLMNLIAAVVAMAIAGMSPMLLTKFAPVLPSGVGQQTGPSVSAPSKSAGQGPSQGVKDLSGAKAASRDAVSENSSKPAGTSAPASSGGDSEQQPGALVNHLRELKAGKGSAGAPGKPAETAGKEPGAPKPAEAGAPKPASAAGGTGAAAGEGASSMAAAGAAESSTGVGAVVGIPTMLAAGATAAGEKAKELGEEGLRMSEAAGQYAAGDMKDDTER